MVSESRLYRAFGLHWQSALPLPELRDAVGATGNVLDNVVGDVTVEIAAAPRPDAPMVVPGVHADAGTFWMEVPEVARFLVTGGHRMVVEPLGSASEGDIRAFLLGSAAGALLHQRGIVPLHASAVELNGRAVAFVAPSGGGKSTIAMHLHHLGHRVIADDLCAIEIVGGAARLWPGLRNLKLWRGSLEAIERAPDGFEPVLGAMDKYRVPVDALSDDRAFDLAAVVQLDWGDTPRLDAQSGAEAVGVLIANTFRGQLVQPMGRTADHWRQCLDLFNACDVLRLLRPRALDRLDEVSALVLARFGGGAVP